MQNRVYSAMPPEGEGRCLWNGHKYPPEGCQAAISYGDGAGGELCAQVRVGVRLLTSTFMKLADF